MNKKTHASYLLFTREQLAAERFVEYWEARRDLFGPHKYHLRMTLGEALCDDLVALRTGVFSLLPYSDASGRRIVFFHPHLHTRKGYTTESMVSGLECRMFSSSFDSNEICFFVSVASILVFDGNHCARAWL